MLGKTKLRKLQIRCCFIAVVLLLAVLLCLPMLPSARERRNDFARLAAEEYDTVFLSMFSIDNYDENDFYHFRLQDTVKTTHELSGALDLDSYMKKITEGGQNVSTVYLGVRPDKLAPDRLLAITRAYPGIHFEVLLAYPSIDYWRGLPDSKRSKVLGSYRSLADALLTEGNVSVYSFLQEWLICNPSNYEDTFLTCTSASQTIFLHCDIFQNNYLTLDNVEEQFAEFSEFLFRETEAPTVYPDLSDCKIVFFGDSVIGNYTDNCSIPGVVHALTQATVYNCGYGGNSATVTAESPITLPGIVTAFIDRDLSPLPADKQVYAGVNEYLEDATPTGKLCFVINYGLNDYFLGCPINGDTPYDTTSYTGAFRTAIEALQKAYPEAQIILMTPNFTSYFNNGQDLMSEKGGVLTDYADAIHALGTEYSVDVLDNYTDLGIDATNHMFFLADGCHPNFRTRFTIGRRIALAIR